MDSIITFLEHLAKVPNLSDSKDLSPLPKLPQPPNATVATATKKSSPTKAPEKADLQLPDLSKPTEVRSLDTPTTTKQAKRIYPRLSDISELESVDERQPEETSPNVDPELFSSSSYKHEISRKERLVNEFKRAFKIISNRQTLALVDSHPNWKTLQECAPNTGIVKVGGLCLPTTAAGLNELREAQCIFPKVTRVLLAIGSNDIAHARCAHHDLHAYSSTWLPYLSKTLSKVFPNATFKFLLPFSSKAVPQSCIDILQQQLAKLFQNKDILQSPFYATNDFDDALHLNPSTRSQFTKFIAKVLTDGKLQGSSLQVNRQQRNKIISLMNIKLNMPSNPSYSSYVPSQVLASRSHDMLIQPNIQAPPNLPNIPYLAPHSIPSQHRTYAQVAATANTGTNSPHEILSQLTSLLPKLLNVISKYQ